VLLLLFLACNISEGKFYKKAFRLRCDNWEQCDADDFALHYDSTDDCFDTEWGRTGTYIQQYENDGCTFEPSEAHACLQALKEIDCDTWTDDTTAPEDCYFVWTCPEED
jgi:hypothetical protein